MKPILYTLMVLCAFSVLSSCKKSEESFTIKQYDADQIQQYIKANGLTGMVRDTAGGDTTGIYYQVLQQGTGAVIGYPDKVPFSYTAKTFDGKYSSADTVLNHTYNFAAYVAPNGLQLAVKNAAKRFGTKIRVLIPSRLMYGINGTTLSAYNSLGAVVYSNITGNQCFDYTVNVVKDVAAYDDLSIVKYMAANGLTGQYTKTASGLWYRVVQAGTGTDPISISTTVGVQYTGTLFNGVIFDQANSTDATIAATSFTLYDVIPAWQEGFPKVKAGAKLSLLSPSRLAYGNSSNSSGSFPLPGFSCLRFDINVVTVTN